jgi:hypothetical protein
VREIRLTEVDPGLLTWLLEVERKLVRINDSGSSQTLHVQWPCRVATFKVDMEGIVSRKTQNSINWFGNSNLLVYQVELKVLNAGA